MLATDVISTRKRDVLTRAAASDVIFMEWKGKYRTVQDHHHLLRLLIDTHRPMIHEYVRKDQPVNLFFDIDFKHTQSRAQLETTLTRENVLDALHDKLLPFLEPFASHRRVVLSCHTEAKSSFHVIYKLFTNEGLVLCPNKKWIKTHVVDARSLSDLKDGLGQSVIDPAVYNDGTLQTFRSFKEAPDSKPFVFDRESQHIDRLECFIGFSNVGNDFSLITLPHASTSSTTSVSTSSTRPSTLADGLDTALAAFVTTAFSVPVNSITRTGTFGTSHPPVYVVEFKDRPCKIANREHRSNTQYVVVGPRKATYRCFDVGDCSQSKNDRKTVPYAEYTDELKTHIHKPSEEAKRQMKAVIRARTNDSPPGSPVYDIELGQLKVPESSLSSFWDENDPGTHVMSPTTYKLRRLSNSFKFNNALEDAPLVVKHLEIHQHFYGTEETTYTLKLPPDLFSNSTLTTLWETAINLTGEDTLAELFSMDEGKVVYSNGLFYCFTGKLWSPDDEGIHSTRRIKTKLVAVMDKIMDAFHDDERALQTITKTRKLLDSNKGLSNILSRSKGALEQKNFASSLNSNVRLIPFTNGVYDIELRCFRDYTIDDRISKTVNYVFDPSVSNPEVQTMLTQILPVASIRSFFVNSIAKALDGSIPNTRFVMMIGETAANGKTCIMSLMNQTFGGLSETINPSVLTRKEGDAAAASPHLAKLANTRLVCLSEPERGEMNTSALKRLFGGETVNARFLHQNEFSFKVIAKAFIACNHPPKIDATDAGVWRRIIVIPFTSRFVETPVPPNEFKVDETLSYRIESDITFRQTFMNMLLASLAQDDPLIPQEVLLHTTQVRECNDVFTQWLRGTITADAGHVLTLQDIVQAYKGDSVKATKVLSKYKGRIDAFLLEYFSIDASGYTNRLVGPGTRKRGWVGINITK